MPNFGMLLQTTIEIEDHNEACTLCCAVREMRKKISDDPQYKGESRRTWLSALDSLQAKADAAASYFDGER